MSAVTLNTDIVRALGIPWAYAPDPSNRLRGWQEGATTIQQFRREFEQQTGKSGFYHRQ